MPWNMMGCEEIYLEDTPLIDSSYLAIMCGVDPDDKEEIREILIEMSSLPKISNHLAFKIKATAHRVLVTVAFMYIFSQAASAVYPENEPLIKVTNMEVLRKLWEVILGEKLPEHLIEEVNNMNSTLPYSSGMVDILVKFKAEREKS